MKLARALARLALAARRPARRVPWLRLVHLEATPKPTGPASDWTPPSPDVSFDEKWDEFPILKASSAAWMKRKAMPKADFEKLTDAVKARSFTAARVASQKGLYDTLVSLQHGVSEGLTIREWREKFWDDIQKKHGKPGGTAPWYTLTVFRTNQQAAFAAGRYAEMFSEDQVALQPLVRYSAILDGRVRPEHAALHDRVFSKTDPYARRYFPPLGFNCRCHLEAVSPDEEAGVTVTNGAAIPDLALPGGKLMGPPPKGWDTDRIDALLESFKLTKAAKAPVPLPIPATAPLPPPPPPKPLYGEPGWAAANGLTQEAAEDALLWNPKIEKVLVKPDGSLRVKYKSVGWVDVAADKAPTTVANGAKKKLAAAVAPPPAAPAPKAAPVPTPKPAAPPPLSPPPPPVPAKDPLYGLKAITDHHSDPLGYDPSWTAAAGEKRSFGAVVFDEHGRILVREPQGHYDNYVWTFPKGKGAKGESALAAAMREVSEETGVKFEAVGTVKGSHKGGSGTNHYFLGRATSSSGALDSETARIRWVGWDEAESLIKQTTNVTGQARDLKVLHEAVAEYERLTGKKPPTFPKVTKPKPVPTLAEIKPPPPVIPKRPIPVGAERLPHFDGFPDDPSKLRVVRSLGGSTGAELVEDAQGRRFVRKTGKSAAHLKEECYADAAYRAAGVNVPEFRLYDTKAGPVKLSKYIEGESLADVLSKGGARAEAVKAALQKDLAVDALFGNWDVVGAAKDNVLVDVHGVPWRIDNGGSFRFRAMGERKTPGDWNHHPTEFWTLRDAKKNAEAAAIFHGTKWDAIVDRLEKLGLSRDAILACVPPDLRAELAGRFDVVERLARTSREMFNDRWDVGYVDSLSRHRVGLGQAGVLDKMPTTLTGSHTGLRDSLGRNFGGLRDKNGATAALYDYMKAHGGDPSALASYMGAQAGSSQSSASHALKDWLMSKRPPARPGAYDGVAKEATLRGKLKEWARANGIGLIEYNETMTAQHAFTVELLGRVEAKDNLPGAGVVSLGRSEDTGYHHGRRVGWTGAIPINPAESTFWGGHEFGSSGGGRAFFRWDNVPHHRVFVTYWQSRYGRMGQSGLYGDHENEFVAMLEGLLARRYK